jgi:hypothetical protein
MVYTGSIPVRGTINFPDLHEGLKTIPDSGATMPHWVVAQVALFISYRGTSQIKKLNVYMNQQTIKGVQ